MAKRRFQFHLSTALIWMVVGSAFLGFNYRSYKFERSDTQGMPHTLNFQTRQAGWPFICITDVWNNFFEPQPVGAGSWRLRYREEIVKSLLGGGPESDWKEYTTTDLNLLYLALNIGVLFCVIFFLKWIFNSNMLRRKDTNVVAQSKLNA